jgi:hypothetical protein
VFSACGGNGQQSQGNDLQSQSTNGSNATEADPPVNNAPVVDESGEWPDNAFTQMLPALTTGTITRTTTAENSFSATVNMSDVHQATAYSEQTVSFINAHMAQFEDRDYSAFGRLHWGETTWRGSTFDGTYTYNITLQWRITGTDERTSAPGILSIEMTRR